MKMKKFLVTICAAIMATATLAIPASAAYGSCSKTLSGKNVFDKNSSNNSWTKTLGTATIKSLDLHATMRGQYYDNVLADKVQTYITDCPYGVWRWSYVSSGSSARQSGNDVKDGQARSEKLTLKNSKATFKIYIHKE